jgi:radical SAM superfamily enzyme YgiQ (UPF0313 family)
MGPKLLLVNPVSPRPVGLASNPISRFPPLGLGIVAALTPSHWNVEIADENFGSFECKDASLVGLTAFTAAATRAYEIASLCRQRGIPTVLGGIHGSMLPEEALQYVDAVVVGEAEGAWPKVVADFEAGKMQRIYRGDLQNLRGMPKPRRDLFHPTYAFGTIQTSRGCPMDCDFCSVSAFNGRRYRHRPVEEVLDELETIPHKRLFIVDDNIVGYGKRALERALALFKGIIERGIKKEWICQASLNFADNEEVLEQAARAGCRVVFIGVEAESVEALAEVNKRTNLRMGVDAYEEAFRRIRRHGIAVLGAFIYGMDSDTPDALRRRTDYILNSGVDIIQITYLTPLPGTRLFDRLQKEGRLLYTDFPADWERYHMVEATHRPLLMEPQEVLDVIREGNHLLYSRRALLRRFAKTWRATRSFTTAMWALRLITGYRNIAIGTGHF